jgi:hypothetical protein
MVLEQLNSLKRLHLGIIFSRPAQANDDFHQWLNTKTLIKNELLNHATKHFLTTISYNENMSLISFEFNAKLLENKKLIKDFSNIFSAITLFHVYLIKVIG